jgi:hypothetical protein
MNLLLGHKDALEKGWTHQVQWNEDGQETSALYRMKRRQLSPRS